MKKILLASLTFGASFLWAQCPPAAPVPAPISESFTSEAPGQIGNPTGTVLGNCWTMYGTGSSGSGFNWQTEDANGQNENSLNTGPHYDATTYGSSGGMYIYLETSIGTTGDSAYFVSPSIDISTLSSAELKFAYHMFGATMGDLAVQVNDGSGWVNVWSVSGQQQTAGNAPWLNAAISLSGFVSPITVRFAGVKGTSFTSDMALDEIAIAVPPLCPNPSSLGAIAGSTSADVYWAAGDAAASSWDVEYGAPGFTQGAGTVSVSTNDTLMLTGLSPITSYEFYVRETCVSVSGNSNWVGPYSFTTTCPPVFQAPYTEDFESALVGSFLDFGNCWTTPSTTVPRWESEDATGSNENSPGTGPHFDNTTYGSAGGKYMFFEASGGSVGSSSNLISPEIDVSSLTAPYVEFYYHMFGGAMGTLNLDVWNAALGWSNGVVSISGQQHTAGSDPWLKIGVAVPAGYDSIVQFRFRAVRGAGFRSDMSVDDFSVLETPLCPSPFGISASNITPFSADINFTGTGNGYNVEWGITGFPQGSGTIVNDTTNPVMLNGLPDNSTLDVYVQIDCDSNGVSTWEGPITFTTPAACPAPTNGQSFNVTGNSADITWNSAGIINGYTFEYGPAGFSQGSGTVINTANDTLSLTGLSGLTSYDYFIQQDCDTNGTSLWAGPFTFTTACGIFVAPYFEDFETATLGANTDFGNCWVMQNTTAPNWEAEDATGSNENTFNTGPFFDNSQFGTAGGTYMYLEANGGATGSSKNLRSGDIDVSSLTTPYVEFYYHMYGAAMGTMAVDVFDQTLGWTNDIISITGQQQTSGADPWQKIGAVLPAGYDSIVRFRFRGIRGTGFTSDMSVDDFSVFEAPACPDVSSLMAILFQGGTAAQISWNGQGGNSFNVEYGPAGFGQGSGTFLNFNVDSVLLTGLTPITSYDVYVQNDCSSNGAGTSNWVGPFTFTTACGVSMAPYFEDFEGVTPGRALDYGNCWTIPNTTTPAWEAEDASGANENSLNTGPHFDNTTPGVAGGMYMYLETSGGFGNTGEITSADIGVNLLTSPYVEFYYHMYGATMGTMAVDVFDQTLGWTNDIISITGQQQTAGNDPWLKVGAVLPAGYDSIVRFRIRGTSTTSFTSDMAIDDFSVIEAPLCPDVTSIIAGLIQGFSAEILWNGQGGSNFNIEYGPQGFGQGSGTVLTSLVDSILISGLTPVTSYDVYIQNDCSTSGNGTSNWVGPFTFTTTVTCPAPTNVQVAQSTTSAAFAWTPAGAAYQNYVFGPAGTTPATGTIQTTQNDTVSVSGLAPSTPYTFWVRDSCGVGDVSTWVGPLDFNTLCVSASMPYLRDFDGTNWPPLCWDLTGGTQTVIQNSSDYMEGNYWSWSSGQFALATTEPITISSDARVKYRWAHQFNTTYPNDQLIVMVRLANSTAWDTLVNHIGPTFNSPNTSPTVPPSDADFIQEAVNLDPAVYTGNDVIFRMVFNSGFGPDVFVDDFIVEPLPACPEPTSVTAVTVNAYDATLSWSNGSATANQWYIEYGAAGFAPGTGTIVPATTNPFTLTGLAPSTNYEFYVAELCPNGIDTSNFIGPVSFQTLCVAASIPYLRDFDGPNWPPLCWNISGQTAMISQGASDYIEASFWSYNNAQAITSTEPINISVDARVKFRWAHLYNANYPFDQMILRMRDANGTQWDTLANFIGQTFSSPNAQTTTPPADGDFVQETFNLNTAYTGQDVVFEFVFNSDWGPDVFVDDFIVEPLPACPEPTTVTASAITATTADLSWANGNAAANTWYIEYGPIGFPLGSGTVVTANSNPFTLTGLNPATGYTAYVLELCQNGLDTSAYSTPVSFSTACATAGLPYNTGFTGVSPGITGSIPLTPLSNCWEIGGANAPRWETEDASGANENSFNTGPFYDATTPGVAGGMYLYLECSGGSLGDTAAAKMVPVDLGAGNTDLEFYYHMYGASMGNLYVQINDGSGWTTLDTLAGQQQTAGSDSFLLRVVPLTGYAGIVSIKFLGERGSNFYSDMAIDEISVVTNGNPNCPTPQLVSDSTYCTTAVMNWVSGSGSSFCEYGPAGFTPGTGTMVNNAVSPLVVSGLNLNTAYDYYVYDICNGGTDTSFAAVGTVTTSAGPIAAFNFGVNQGTVAFDGSISTGTNSWSWDFGDGNSGTGATPTHTFLSNGSYNVTLVVTDSTCGITDSLVQVVTITNVATCPQPSGLFTRAVECDSAVISWTSISGASLIEYGPAGFTPGTGNQLSATSPFVLTGLNAGQSYEYWIADVCAATSDTSGFSGPIAFATPTAPVPTVNASFVLSSVTLTQATVDFDASNSLNGSSYTWDFGNATGGNGPTPTATYVQNGTYFVQLTVANGCGSADTIIEVTIAGISVDEEELASSLNIFPNPTKDVVNVVIENPSTNDYSVELIDALGQLIEVQSVQDARGHTELRFDLSTRAQGVYLLRVRTGEAAITRRVTRY